MTFTDNLSTKLNLAVEPKLISLDAVAQTADITVANTETVLCNYSSPKMDSFDIIECVYSFFIDNDASGANEGFTVTIDAGGAPVTSNYAITVNNSTSTTITATVKAVKINSSQFLVNITLHNETAGTTTTYYIVTAESNITGFLVKAVNGSTAGAGLTITGYGGYVLLDNVNRV